MKFSKETLALLKNFASINTNIVFKQGDTVSTISNLKNIFAKATIKESIPNEFAIYDLNSLLAMLTLIENQDVEFGDKCLTVTSSSGRFEFYYSNPEIVTGAPSGEIQHTSVYKFKMTAEDAQMLMKAAAILQLPNLTFAGEDNKITVKAHNAKDPSADIYKVELGDIEKDCNLTFRVDNIKLLPGDYTVKSSGKQFGEFKADDVTYWVAAES